MSLSFDMMQKVISATFKKPTVTDIAAGYSEDLYRLVGQAFPSAFACVGGNLSYSRAKRLPSASAVCFYNPSLLLKWRVFSARSSVPSVILIAKGGK